MPPIFIARSTKLALALALVAVLALKVALATFAYFNIDYFIYSFIADTWTRGDTTVWSAFFPPLNSWLQYAIQRTFDLRSVGSIILAGNAVGLVFSLLSLGLVFLFLDRDPSRTWPEKALFLVFAATTPYVLFHSSFGDAGNIYAFFITLLVYARFVYGYESLSGKLLHLVPLAGLLLSRKESFLIIGIFFAFEFVFSPRRVELLKLLLAFLALELAPFMFAFHAFTGHWYYVEVEAIFRGLLGYRVASYDDVQRTMLGFYVADPTVTGWRAGLANAWSQSKNIFSTFLDTIGYVTAIFGTGGLLYKSVKERDPKYALPLFFIAGILATYFVLWYRQFTGALYDIDTLFKYEGFEGFQRYFMPLYYAFLFGVMAILSSENRRVGAALLGVATAFNLAVAAGAYHDKWRNADYDDYTDPIATYGGLGLSIGYLTPGDVELAKLVRARGLEWPVLYASARTQSAQIINMAFLSGRKTIVTYYPEGAILPGASRGEGVVRLDRAGLYEIANNYERIRLVSADASVMRRYDPDELRALGVHFVQIDTDYISPEDYFGRGRVPEVAFSRENVRLYALP